jgi:hypothetical protein
LETQHADEKHSGRVKIPCLKKIQMEHRQHGVRDSASRAWNVKVPLHQAKVRYMNEKKRGKQNNHAGEKQARVRLKIARHAEFVQHPSWTDVNFHG